MSDKSAQIAAMDKIVALCRRRGFIFQSSEIYGGLNGFWDYGPLGVELKRNVKEAWWKDMITNHDEYLIPDGTPSPFQMVGLDCSLIMHPSVWKSSGHYDLFHDFMVDCRQCQARFRADHVQSSECPLKPSKHPGEFEKCQLTPKREFNLMFKTIVGAMGGEEDAVFLRPETAQGMFVNFKNVTDTSRVRVPFGIAQMGKSFRNEITPRNFTFRSREFEQMEMEFFCHPSQSLEWYRYWRDRRYKWYLDLGLNKDRLQMREHDASELAHYSVGTADIEYSFPFLGPGEFGELEGVAHRGDFDLRSHMEGKLARDASGNLSPELKADGSKKYPGSGKDLTYFDDQSKERFIPHVIEPAAGADRATLAFLCEAYYEDKQPDETGAMQERTVLRLHPKLAPVKAAVFPLVKKGGMPEAALAIYREIKSAGYPCVYDQQAAIGRRYRRQDEIGTPYCITVDGQTIDDKTVTIRDRDTLEQRRIPVDKIVDEIAARVKG